MKTVLVALVLFAAVLHTVLSCPMCEGEGLKCYTCVAKNADECFRQGSTVCPAHSDACSTITGPNSVMKSCAYKSFCDKSHMSNGEMKLECCFNDECNGPHRSHSHGEHHNTATSLSSSPVLLLGLLLLRLALSSL
ncbi:uncharacterized protein si:ch211-113d22.2 isoform X1 [Carassius carassius]|uniref:uncharacterized protein si:ch211-113d22.2 isoform X1 n=1 Tax=Carassius carassius TaxID=217509 RepID=UPI002868F040|nr:uncharacterized protein si:ch211-113d22.2 isoform X1 [Carassius carassius]